MKSTLRYLFILFLPTLLMVPEVARSGAQEAHRHGQAKLMLALENGVLEIQFETPAANLVGFEHIAKSAEQREAVRQADIILKQPDRLFSFVGTDCQAKITRVDLSGVLGNEQHRHDHHNHSTKHDEGGHSEIFARYQFNCPYAEKLDSVSVLLFKPFPGIEKIDTIWVSETRQGAVSLTSSSSAVSLR